MKEQAKGQKAMVRLVRNAAGPLLMMAMVLGCDTTAEIDFEEIRLASVKVLGYRASACGELEVDPLCDAVGCGQLDFVLLANDERRYLTPGRKVEQLGVLTPGDNFGGDATDVQFTQRAWLFELDAEGFDRECTDASGCSPEFECRALAADQLSSTSALAGRTLCVREASVEPDIGSLHYNGLGENPQPSNDSVDGDGKGGVSLVLALDNSGSIKGQDASGNFFVDKATDNQHRALAALRTLATEVARNLSEDKVQFGVFQLSGDGAQGVDNLLLNNPAINATFAPDVSTTGTTIESMQNKVAGKTPVWESYFAAAEAFSSSDDNAHKNWRRHTLSMLDSGPDGSLESLDGQDVINKLVEPEVEATATIVHFDSLRAGSVDPTRSGPNAEYAQVSCATGGHYVYETNTEALTSHVQRLADGFAGLWEIEVQTTVTNAEGRVKPLSELPAGWYRLAATLQIRVGDVVETVHLDKEETSGGTFSASYFVDNRLLFHVPAATN